MLSRKTDFYKAMGMFSTPEILSNLETIVSDKEYKQIIKLAANKKLSRDEAYYNYCLKNKKTKLLDNVEFNIGTNSLQTFTFYNYNTNGVAEKIVDLLKREGFFDATVMHLNDQEVFKGSVSLMVADLREELDKHIQNIVSKGLIYNTGSGSGRLLLLTTDEQLKKSNSKLFREYFNYEKENEFTDSNGYKVIYATIKKRTDVTSSFKSWNEYEPPSVPYQKLKENHELHKDKKAITSNSNSDVWDWFKTKTTIEQPEEIKIDKAVPLKIGELSNLIASGMINGELDLPNGNGRHVVAGGMKELMKKEESTEVKNGAETNKTKTTIYSQPYLNILINKNGKMEIKELEGEGEL